MISNSNGCLSIVPGLSPAVLHYPVHQYGAKRECGVSKGIRCGLQQIRVHQFCKVLGGIKILVIYKMYLAFGIPTGTLSQTCSCTSHLEV